MRDRKVLDLDGRWGDEELGRAEGGENHNQNILYEKYIFSTEENKINQAVNNCGFKHGVLECNWESSYFKKLAVICSPVGSNTRHRW